MYLPTFYVFKAGVFSTAWDASEWVKGGIGDSAVSTQSQPAQPALHPITPLRLRKLHPKLEQGQFALPGCSFQHGFSSQDVFDVFRVWGPADLVCFSVPLWLRLPVRHARVPAVALTLRGEQTQTQTAPEVVSFVWTAYLSFARGANK